MKDRPFLEIAMLFLLVALLFANAWDFLFRHDHPLSSLLVSLLVGLVFVVGFLHAFRKKS